MMAGLAKMTTENEMGSCKEDLGTIIGILFMSRTYSHIAHLKTGSYAKHKALNKFYDSVVDMADSLAEASQGLYGKLEIPYLNMIGKIDDPIGGITSQLKAIEKLIGNIDEEYLKNILQEIQALYRKTLYLLVNLD